MSARRIRRPWAWLTLALALALVWPAVPVSGLAAAAMAMDGDDTVCVQCCFRCDDAGVPQAPCPGSAMGCLGLVAMTVHIELTEPTATSAYRSATPALFRSRVTDADPPPPRPTPA